ncbi:MAG: hypothetical protein K8S99_12330 [Planctomycetes bacterium]|nr:hypothetical protein [Planctomycetota bacterium]
MANVVTWPGPKGEPESPDFAVVADDQKLFVYQARVRAEILQKEGLWSHKPDPVGQCASFCIFDTTGPAKVVVRPAKAFKTAAVLPPRAGIVPVIADGTLSFMLDRPRHVTIILDGDDSQALHLFVAEPETDVPRADDPNVIYFGPGIHEITTLEPRSGQTVNLAGGAVVRAGLKPGETGTWNEQWKVTFIHGSVITLKDVAGVRVCGRGILDSERVPHPGRSMIGLSGGRDIRLEGITLRDASNWNVVIGRSRGVRVTDLRLISGRLNSDGINSVNSRDMSIRRCFVRNHDDSIVAKTTEPGDPCENIDVSDCVIWNDWGYALGVSYETRAPIRHLRFHRCDIISSRHWCLGVHLSDGATVSDIHFADIEVADLTSAARLGGSYAALTQEPVLLKMVITRDVWGKDKEYGRVRDVMIEDVTVYGGRMLGSEILGADAGHDVRGVTLRHIRLAGGAPATDTAALRLRTNEHVHELRIEPGGGAP